MRALAATFGLALLSTPSVASAYGPPPPPSGGSAAPVPIKAPPPPSAPQTAPSDGPTAPRGGTPPPPPGRPGGEAPSDAPPPEQADPVDLGGTWSYARGSGRQPRLVRTQDDDPDIAPNPEGYYSGVSIEGNHVPPFPAAKMGTKPASMTWTGFERVGEGSRVFLEVSADVATKLEVKGNVVTVRLSNTKINVRNNARSLDLRYFRTPVRSVKVSRRGRDAVATIVLKRAVEPTISWIAGKAGYRLLVVDFAGATSSDAAPQ